MIVILTTALILLCLVVVLLILIQRSSGGMGSALGGGAADQVLGAGSAAQLTKLTVYGILGFFILSFALYAFYQNEADSSGDLQRLGTIEPVLKPDLSVPSIPDDASDLPSAPPVLPIDGQVPQTDSEPELNSSK